jgi:hypothetical protein
MSGYFDHHQQVQYGLPFWSPTPTKSDLAKSDLAKSELAHHIHGQLCPSPADHHH